jgi:hypothetical protein
MEGRSPEQKPNNEKQTELANAWSKRFDRALEEASSDPNLTLVKLSDIIWEKGTLEHISPSDPDEFQARQELGKLAINREDPELYARLVYCAEHIRHGIQNNLSLASGYIPVVPATVAVYANPEFKKQINPDRIVFDLLDSITKKSNQKLQELNIQNFKPIPIGSMGTYEDIPVKVVRYTIDGALVLEAENFESYKKLGEATDFTGTVSPLNINPDNFK